MKSLDIYANRRLTRLEKLLRSFSKQNEFKSFHDIRLEIKKIKMLLSLIQFNNKNFKSHKYYIPFRTIFRLAGKLREAGLHADLLARYTHIHTPFYRSPGREFGKFKKSIPQFLKSIKKNKKEIIKEIKHIKLWMYQTYLQRKKASLNKRIKKGYTEEELHKIRKHIKELIYLMNISKQEATISSLIVIAEKIGNWHDKKSLLLLLNNKSADDLKTIRILKNEIKEDVKTIRPLLRNYITLSKQPIHTNLTTNRSK
jgi:CHAD domain-containing protein